MSDTDTEAAQAPPRRRVASRRRGLEIAGLVLGIAAGVGVAVGWLIPSLRHLSGPAPVNSPPVVVHDSSGSFPSPGSPMAPDPPDWTPSGPPTQIVPAVPTGPAATGSPPSG